jgi:uncharacterized membrane protein YphA (DoxX/SURF4 family)
MKTTITRVGGTTMLAVATLIVRPHLALAHERWLLSPYELQALLEAPPPAIMAAPGPTMPAMAAAALLAMLVARALDAGLQPDRAWFEARFMARLWPPALLALRLGLATLMIAGALGLTPRHGEVMGNAPTLLVPDLELRLIGPEAAWLVPVQLALGAMLALGVMTRLAAALTLGLVAYAFAAFDPVLLLPYAGHVAAPAGLLLAAGAGPIALHRGGSLGADRAAMALACFRILVGVTFVALAIVDKLLNAKLLVHILTVTGFPTLGLGPELAAAAMATVEIVLGILLVAGVMTRWVAAAMLLAMLMFVVILSESMRMHGHLYASALALLLLGGGRLRAPRRASSAAGPAGRWAGAMGAALAFDGGLAAALAGSLALASAPAWATGAGRALPMADASIVRLEGEREQPTVALRVEQDGPNAIRIGLATTGFEFLDLCAAMPGSAQTSLGGHAHVFLDGRKGLTLGVPEGRLTGLVPGRHEVAATLNTVNHRAIVATHGLVVTAVTIDVAADGTVAVLPSGSELVAQAQPGH